MEKEMLDLVRAFEVAAAKMEKMDGTVEAFTQVIADLHGHLDELIEMVQLEDIVTLSRQATAKLNALTASLDEALAAKLRFEQQTELLERQEAVGLHGQTVYQLQDGQLVGRDLVTGVSWPVAVAGPQKLDGNFLLAEQGVFLVEGAKAALILEGAFSDFYVHGHRLVYLAAGSLYRYHLLLRTTETIAEEVESVRLLKPGHALLVEAKGQQTVELI